MGAKVNKERGIGIYVKVRIFTALQYYRNTACVTQVYKCERVEGFFVKHIECTS